MGNSHNVKPLGNNKKDTGGNLETEKNMDSDAGMTLYVPRYQYEYYLRNGIDIKKLHKGEVIIT